MAGKGEPRPGTGSRGRRAPPGPCAAEAAELVGIAPGREFRTGSGAVVVVVGDCLRFLSSSPAPPQEWMASGSAFLEERLQTADREVLPPPAAGGGHPERERERGCWLWNLLSTPPLSFSPSLSLSTSAEPACRETGRCLYSRLEFLGERV